MIALIIQMRKLIIAVVHPVLPNHSSVIIAHKNQNENKRFNHIYQHSAHDHSAATLSTGVLYLNFFGRQLCSTMFGGMDECKCVFIK